VTGGGRRTRGSRGGRSRATADLVELHQMVRRAAIVALCSFVVFALFDVYLYEILFPAARLARVFAFRAVGVVALIGFVTWSFRPERSERALVAATSAMFAGTVALVALMGTELGGLDTDYTYGLAFYYGGTAAIVPSPWRRTLVMLAPSHVVYFAVLTAGVALEPAHAWQWQDRVAVAELSVGALITTALLAFFTVSSHLLWTSRRQLNAARRLGRYRLTSPLGEGGMNEVWLARDDTLHREVALKILRDAPGLTDDRWVRFEREAQVASTLVSPHTIKIHDYGASDDGVAYIAMEYLRGLDLDGVVAGWGPLDVRRAVHFVKQACLSLGEAHARGLVHRDVKPGNLFALSTPGHEDFLKVLDFGVVRELHAAPADVTQEGKMIGTPAFMAPEQFAGGEVTAAADVYAVGATLYFLLTGSAPFEVEGDARLWRAHATQPVAPPSERRGAPVPVALEAVIARCLAKHPVDRYPDCAALAAALDQVTEVEPWSAGDAHQFWAEARLRPPPARLGSPTSSAETSATTKNASHSRGGVARGHAGR
jgi:eukaryotic-like serine/threonine-protein kinase